MWFRKWKVYWLRGKTRQEGAVSDNNFQVFYLFFLPFVLRCLDLDIQTNALQVSVYLCALFYDTSVYCRNVKKLMTTIQGTLVVLHGNVTWSAVFSVHVSS